MQTYASKISGTGLNRSSGPARAYPDARQQMLPLEGLLGPNSPLQQDKGSTLSASPHVELGCLTVIMSLNLEGVRRLDCGFSEWLRTTYFLLAIPGASQINCRMPLLSCPSTTSSTPFFSMQPLASSPAFLQHVGSCACIHYIFFPTFPGTVPFP